MDDILPMRVLPQLGPDNTGYWTSGHDGVLRIERCACGTYNHPPTGRCPSCFGREVAFTPMSGRGTVYSFTVNHQQWVPGSEPYAVILVDLAEGTSEAPIRITSNLVGTAPDDITIGMPVEVCFLHRDDVWLPQFRAVEVES